FGNGWRVAFFEDQTNSLNEVSGAWANSMVVVVVRGGQVGTTALVAESVILAGDNAALPTLALDASAASLVIAGVMSNQASNHTLPAG
ncbi:hypothetical protein, partial [Streptococcus pseudopneumoniae]|uniref:hypothetical protein n=1 Tax=Streptococcus pseudopneumoniae TaxID=257758 RepID=UPI0019D629C3